MQYKMKYTSYLAALSVLFATACAKEEITEYTAPAMPEDAVRFSGSVERLAGTRTSYEDTEESVTVQWADKDRIGTVSMPTIRTLKGISQMPELSLSLFLQNRNSIRPVLRENLRPSILCMQRRKIYSLPVRNMSHR